MTDAKPKLLLILTSSAWGGAERYVARLSGAAGADFDVTVAAGASKRHELFKALAAGVRAIELPELVRPIAPLQDLHALFRLRRLIDTERFDLIHANSSKAGLIATLAARLSHRRPPVVYTAHGWGFMEKRSWLFRQLVLWSERLAGCFRAATIVLTRGEYDTALRYGLSTPERLRMIPIGIDPTEMIFLDRETARKELSDRCGSALPARLIGTIANAYPSKNLPGLLEAFDALADEVSDVGLVILGDGPDMPALRASHAQLRHRDRVFLPGAMPEAARYAKGFDLFVLVSTKEGLPFAVLEASLAGIPIVATRVGALPELIQDGETGLLIPSGNAPALTAALRSVLEDRHLFQKLKNGSPRVAESRSGSAMIDATLALYRRLIPRSR